MLTIQNIIHKLEIFWKNNNCAILCPIDMEVGAASFHTESFFKAIGPEPWKAAFVQPSRRPLDSRYGKHPNRLQSFHQYQVIIKPSPTNLQELFIKSLAKININTKNNDIKFIEDNWESPTIGAWGLGWEVVLNGTEICQFTYFQQMGGIECKPIMGEISYGIERLALHIQKKTHINNLMWSNNLKYSDIYLQKEKEYSKYNLEIINKQMLVKIFNNLEIECINTIKNKLPYPAYEIIIKLSHYFNLLDARSCISIIERQNYINKIRNLSLIVAKLYYNIRYNMNYPLNK